MSELPFGIASKPSLKSVRHVDVLVDDHLGKSSVDLLEWANGEGFTLSVWAGKDKSEIDLTYSQITAFKLCLKTMGWQGD